MEYTKEEIEINGNQMYGGKRHDEICDYLQKSYKFSDKEINDISMGVWLAIDSERKVQEPKISALEEKIEVAFGVLSEIYKYYQLEDNDRELVKQAIEKIRKK